MSAFIGPVCLNKEDVELLEKLLEVDGENGTMFIYDAELRRALQDNGFVAVNKLGWMWGTARLKTVLPKIIKIVAGK